MNEFVSFALDTGQPINKLLQKLNAEQSKPHYANKKRAYEEVYSDADVETFCGKVLTVLVITGSRGRELAADFIDPFSLLVVACATSLDFFRLMQGCVQRAPGNILRMALYHDGVTPGNCRRPDVARSFVSWLWTWLELPHWMRQRSALRWMTCLYIQKKKMTEHDITIPHIAKALLKHFFKRPECNFLETGILLKHGSEAMYLQMRPSCAPQDYEAHEMQFDLKGASGLSPCPYCDNCIGRRQYFEDDSGFAHVLSSHVHKFVIRSPERMQEILAELKETAEHGRPSELSRSEVATGIVYSPDGIMFDPEIAGLFTVPQAIYMDLTHCLMASGGIAQYSINQFVLSIIRKTDMELKDFDEFATDIKVVGTRLSKTWFVDRIVDDVAGCFRGFASECFSVADTLALFVDVVLEPMGNQELAAEIKCFRHLVTLLQCIRGGTLEDAHKALDANLKHHHDFMILYPLCGKPKLHYTWHGILSWIFWKVLITTFGAESEHKAPKRLMHHCYNNCTKTASAHWIRRFMRDLANPETFQETHLGLIRKSCHCLVQLPRLGAVMVLETSRTIHTVKGIFSSGEFLHWHDNGTMGGIAEAFVKVQLASGAVGWVAHIQRYEHVAAGFWTAKSAVVVNATQILGHAPFLQEKNSWLRPLLPVIA